MLCSTLLCSLLSPQVASDSNHLVVFSTGEGTQLRHYCAELVSQGRLRLCNHIVILQCGLQFAAAAVCSSIYIISWSLAVSLCCTCAAKHISSTRLDSSTATSRKYALRITLRMFLLTLYTLQYTLHFTFYTLHYTWFTWLTWHFFSFLTSLSRSQHSPAASDSDSVQVQFAGKMVLSSLHLKTEKMMVKMSTWQGGIQDHHHQITILERFSV